MGSAERALVANEFNWNWAEASRGSPAILILSWHSFPRLKLVQLPLSLAATLAALPSISEIPFLDSWFPYLNLWLQRTRSDGQAFKSADPS